MRRHYRTINIFQKKATRLSRNRKQGVVSSVENERDNYLINTNDVDYNRYKIDEAKIEPLVISLRLK